MYEKNKDILENGRRIVTLDSWDEFQHRVRNLQSKRGYVWRGQKKDEIGGWPLKSSFDREIQTANKQDSSKKLKKHFAIFKEEMNKFHPNALPSKDIDIWALGQHYGLKNSSTRLDTITIYCCIFCLYRRRKSKER